MRQVPFAWPALAIDSTGVELRFAPPASPGTAHLRITLALEQSACSVVVVETLATAATPPAELARLDLRYGCVFQIFSTPLSPAVAEHIAREPVRLRLLSGPPVTIFAPSSAAATPPDFPPEFAPHLLAAAPPASPAAVLPRLATLACLQPFNWLHGCVVDALADAGDHVALAAHLGRWFHADGHLRYLGPHSEPRLDELFGLEPVLMFAALARPDGLWSVYLDEPTAGSDTSASAGLAAALALGVHAGWLDAPALAASRRADAALALHLTPDAFLGGVAQLNRGGDALQRGGYRVLGQFALGLYGQLRVALGAVFKINRCYAGENPCSAKATEAEAGQRPVPPRATPAQLGFSPTRRAVAERRVILKTVPTLFL